MGDAGWYDSPPSVVESAAPAAQVSAPPVMQESVNSGPPVPASGLPEGWTMEQWAYYGEQYLASMPPAPVDPYAQPAPADPYAQPAQVGYQEPAPTYNPAPTQTFTEPAPSLLNRTMVQEPAPTPASQALADILDDLDL